MTAPLDYKTLIVKREASRLYVTINRPELKNAINHEVVEDLTALTRSIARGYARDNVLAYVVAPGFVRTERQEGVIAARGEEAMVADIPLGDMARPEDIAPLVTFLASGAARHSTGATFDVNGASYFH